MKLANDAAVRAEPLPDDLLDKMVHELEESDDEEVRCAHKDFLPNIELTGTTFKECQLLFDTLGQLD